MAVRPFRFAAVAFLVLAAAASAKRPMTPEDLWAMERAGSPAISPDGRQVVFTVTRFSLEENKADSDLWLVPADGSAPPRRLTWNPASDSRPPGARTAGASPSFPGAGTLRPNFTS